MALGIWTPDGMKDWGVLDGCRVGRRDATAATIRSVSLN